MVDGGNLGDHCYNYRKPYGCCCCTLLLVFIIIMASSWDVIAPTQTGLLKNTFTGVIDMTTPYEAGRYFVGPTMRFIHFPANLITLSFGNNSRDEQGPILARTGADAQAGGGGQPVSLSISFQYQIPAASIAWIYNTFTMNWDDKLMRFAQQAVTNVAQEFTPRAFWTERAAVERAMLLAVKNSLWENGKVEVTELQLRAVGFQTSYENTIIGIQLQEQLRVTKSYQLEVTRVVKEVDLMQSETDASVTEINAEAARDKAVIEGQANANALRRETQARSNMYARLRAHLSWSTTDFLQYIKMKALNAQPNNNVVVGVDPLGSLSSS